MSEVGQIFLQFLTYYLVEIHGLFVEGASSQEGLDRVTSEIGIARAVAEMIQRATRTLKKSDYVLV